jgi:hypothetical protein
MESRPVEGRQSDQGKQEQDCPGRDRVQDSQDAEHRQTIHEDGEANPHGGDRRLSTGCKREAGSRQHRVPKPHARDAHQGDQDNCWEQRCQHVHPSLEMIGTRSSRTFGQIRAR